MINVELQLDEETTIKASVKLFIQKGSVFFEYQDQSGHSIIRESISQFRSFQVSEEDPTKTTIHGPLVDRVIKFGNSEDMAKFYKFLQENASMQPSENDPRTFVIDNKNSGSAEQSKKAQKPSQTSQLQQQQQSLSNFVNSIVQTIGAKIDQQQSPQIIKRNVDAFIYGNIEQILPSKRLTPFSKSDAENSDLTTVPYSALQISEDVYPIIFTRLLKSADLSEEYAQLKGQWTTTTKDEWDHFAKMRIFVHAVEKHIEKSRTLANEPLKRLFFNVALSLFTRYFSELSFSPKLMTVIEILINCFLSKDFKETNTNNDNNNENSNDNNNDNNNEENKGNVNNNEKNSENSVTLTKTTGEKVSLEEAESLIFSHLCNVWEMIRKSAIPSKKESFNIRTLLSTVSHSTLEMLDDRSLDLLDFAMGDADLFFTRGRSVSDSLLLFATALAVGDFAAFRQNMLCVSLILLHERLQLVPIGDVATFGETYCMELRNISVRLLILNNSKMLAHSVFQET